MSASSMHGTFLGRRTVALMARGGIDAAGGPMDGGGGPNLKEGMQNIGAKLGRMKFGIKK